MIKNKYMSDEYLSRWNLNRLVSKVFTNDRVNEAKDYINSSNFKWYNVRDKRPSGKFQYKLTKDEVLVSLEGYDKFTVYESLAEADEHLILQGEIQVTKDFHILASLDDRKYIANRIAMLEPKYIVDTTSLDKKKVEPYGMWDLVNYIVEHNLFDMIVEASLFGIPVGNKQENIIIWEVRNY